jgi:hypothetical protein
MIVFLLCYNVKEELGDLHIIMEIFEEFNDTYGAGSRRCRWRDWPLEARQGRSLMEGFIRGCQRKYVRRSSEQLSGRFLIAIRESSSPRELYCSRCSILS